MSIENEKFCQSCAMPMEGAAYGTESDGSKSADYCSYCYEGGKFCADLTMDQMIDLCAQPMADATGMTPDDAKAQMSAFFPQLKRWQ